MFITINEQNLITVKRAKYAKQKYGDQQIETNTNLGQQLTHVKNQAICYVKDMEAPGQNKLKLYTFVNYWLTATSDDSNFVVKPNNKKQGTVIAYDYGADIAQYTSVNNACNMTKTIIKVDFKTRRGRLIGSIQIIKW